MESLQHLSNESFSYSWLKNTKPSSIDTTEDSLRHSFYFEMDPKSSQPISTTDFDFMLPNSQTLAHADQLFSNGLLLPFHPSPETTTTMKEEDPSSSSHVMVVNNPKNSRRRSTVRPLPLPLDFRSVQRKSKAEDFSRNARLKLPFFGTAQPPRVLLLLTRVGLLRRRCSGKGERVEAYVGTTDDVVDGVFSDGGCCVDSEFAEDE
ncbi:hypothetical protein QJS10_CPA03g00270 [Acorus calamus]|uniref:Uncharacterized protein n=1 Tax=Acorus calamus TaxID=4465 RepID=A0AAV9FAB7_ACOCL|nr:hypothetical protein QJS10_CPA03g00270 [Acorus calamus]